MCCFLITTTSLPDPQLSLNKKTPRRIFTHKSVIGHKLLSTWSYPPQGCWSIYFLSLLRLFWSTLGKKFISDFLHWYWLNITFRNATSGTTHSIPKITDPASFVLPFIGTTNGGHVFPGMDTPSNTFTIIYISPPPYLGATLPQGMVKVGMDTDSPGNVSRVYKLQRSNFIYFDRTACWLWCKPYFQRHWFLAVAWYWHRWC